MTANRRDILVPLAGLGNETLYTIIFKESGYDNM